MRHIAINTFKPSEDWKKLSADATKLLLETKAEDRVAYIKSKDKVWKALGKELIAHFGNKCWYTDAANYGARLDVEHFRPKAKVVELSVSDCKEAGDLLVQKLPDPEREGYWWLAFNEENLLLCAQVINREDKRNFFPLHRDSPVASGANRNIWRNEIPILLDPRKLDDVCLVDYDDTGAMRARKGVEPWDSIRVTITTQCFGLSRFQPLTEGRQKVLQRCTGLIEQYVRAFKKQNDEGTPNPVLQQDKNDALAGLWRLLDSGEPFATVAASCLRNSPYDWAKVLASQQVVAPAPVMPPSSSPAASPKPKRVTPLKPASAKPRSKAKNVSSGPKTSHATPSSKGKNK